LVEVGGDHFEWLRRSSNACCSSMPWSAIRIPFARSLDRGAAPEGALEVVELGEAAKDDVECRLQLARIAVDEVGEDTPFGGLVDEFGVFRVEEEDHRAGGAADDLLDSSSACSELSPRPTSAPSGCSVRVRSATRSTVSSSATTSCPSERAISETVAARSASFSRQPARMTRWPLPPDEQKRGRDEHPALRS
jgi:hypothetical protein